jgi:uncharacterized protein YutE (UPF0331/DUF86 family)
LRRGIHQTLDELSKSTQQQPLRKIERLATERCLQILIEAAIGVGKECCKKEGNAHSGDAYNTLLNTYDLLNSQIPHKKARLE